MIATSLSTQSCPTGLCGQCGPCRREMREADRLMIPKVQAPIELSPTVQQLLAEDRKRERRTRRPTPKVTNRRTTPPRRPTPLPPTTPTPPHIEPCTQCHQPRGLTRGRIDGVGTLCNRLLRQTEPPTHHRHHHCHTNTHQSTKHRNIPRPASASNASHTTGAPTTPTRHTALTTATSATNAAAKPAPKRTPTSTKHADDPHPHHH